MHERRTRGRLLGAGALALAAITIGFVFATPGSGTAASTAAPSDTGTPTISGTAQEGSTLTASTGTWTGSPTSYAYAWQRCNANGDGCITLAAETKSTHVLTHDDAGHTMRVIVTATNADGQASATSVPTAVISAAPVPAETALPSIAGVLAVGSTLTASPGTWSGSPTAYAYAWLRCDATGGNCVAISNAAGTTYVVTSADAGRTLRVGVTATNGSGNASATSAPTAVVPGASSVTGCPAGSGVIPVGDLSAPARLAMDSQTVTPGLVTPSATELTLRVRVTACGLRPVSGALVYATAIPYNQYSVPPEATTGTDGTATLTMSQRSGFPAARRQELLVVFLRAREPGEPVDGGVSSRLLVSFPVSLR